mmetsp:Transcript_1477/g.2686  ORF Transcript_1477/g.2686 Transcript_1477/m.2686 type:complete len:289 (-) Transcript_1477:760-1626(-)
MFLCVSALKVNWLIIGIHTSLLKGLTECRMCMTSTSNIFRTGPIFNSQNTLSNHLSGIRSHNVHSQNLICFLIRQYFDKSIRACIGTCTGIGLERKRTLGIVNPSFFQFLLRFSNGCYLWIGINDSGNRIVIDMACKTSNSFHCGNTFFLGLVSKHRSINAITNGINVWNGSSKVIIYLNSSQAILLNTQFFQTETVCVGSTSSCNQNNIICFGGFLSCLGGFSCEYNSCIGHFTFGNFGFHGEFESLFLESRLELFGKFLVHCWTDSIHEFNDFYLGTKSRPNTSHF